MRKLKLVEDLGERRARVRAVYQAVELRGNPTSSLALETDAPRDLPHLPEALKGETPTTRLVYLYLEPYGEAQVSVRQLEALLGNLAPERYRSTAKAGRAGAARGARASKKPGGTVSDTSSISLTNA